ncbi:MAG: hypothetical protein FWH17_05695 [Oscillospiraceae bacterium]|nr:hypothetical protein [Oscillospiraceae bacterium]
MQALAMTFGNESMAMNMSLQPEYAEPYDWIVAFFRDLAYDADMQIELRNDE